MEQPESTGPNGRAEAQVVSVPLSSETVAEINNIERSIGHHSVEMAKAAIQVDLKKQNLIGLYQARSQKIVEALRENGIDERRILQQKFDQEAGTITLVLGPEIPPPAS